MGEKKPPCKAETGKKQKENVPPMFNIGEQAFHIARGTPLWPVKIVGIRERKYELFYYGTNQSGTSKTDGTDLAALNEENQIMFKTRDSKLKSLKKALNEALVD